MGPGGGGGSDVLSPFTPLSTSSSSENLPRIDTKILSLPSINSASLSSTPTKLNTDPGSPTRSSSDLGEGKEGQGENEGEDLSNSDKGVSSMEIVPEEGQEHSPSHQNSKEKKKTIACCSNSIDAFNFTLWG